MIDPLDVTILLDIPAGIGMLVGVAVWLQARSTRAFDAKWGTGSAAEDKMRPVADKSRIIGAPGE